MGLLHAKSFKNGSDKGFLAETGSGAIAVSLNLNAEELPCWAEIRDLVLFLRASP